MAVPLIRDLAGPPTVGRWYLVPAVLAVDGMGAENVWPVLDARPHADPELSPIAARPHYHLDGRFLTQRLLAMLHWEAAVSAIFVESDDLRRAELRFLSGPQDVRLQCRRAGHHFPVRHLATAEQRLAKWHRPLGGGCLKCPHRGIDLRQVQPDASGIITCPGHGLRWVAATGEPYRETKG